MLLNKLTDDIVQALEHNTLHEVFEMPFMVSMDFDDYKCAKQLMDYMNVCIGSIVSHCCKCSLVIISLNTGHCVCYSQDVIIRTFMGKVDHHMIELLRQYRETVCFSHLQV